MKRSPPVLGVISLSLMGLFDGAHADEGDAFNFHIGQGVRYESNLYRLADENTAPEGKQSDTVSETTVGVKFDRIYGRQDLLADVNLLSERFSVHSNLNHDSPDARFAWEWQLGNRWSGDFSHSYRESLLGFDEASGRTQNLNTYVRSHASADFWWHPSWATGAGVTRATSRFDDVRQAAGEFDTDTVDVNLTYRPATGNRAVLTLRDTDGLYPNRPSVAGSIRDYRQREVRLSGEWQITGATHLSGFIGRTRVEYRLAPERDFSGTIGRIGVLWNATAKSSLALSVRREIGAQQDVAANFAVTEAVTLTPRWAISDKVAVGAGFEWRRRDFRGDPELGSVSTRPKPTDRSYRYGLFAEYRPMRALSFSLSVQHQGRQGSDSLMGYSANVVDLSANLEF